MCNFWSCILLRDGRVLWSPKGSSHEAVLAEHGISDHKLKDRDFVRLEIAPQVIWSKKKNDWAFKVDEPGTLPAWYSDAPRKWEAVVWCEWRKAMMATLWKLNLSAIEGIVQEVKGIRYLDCHGEPLPEWHLSLAETWAAAGDAAGDAARAAARVAAWDAARDAAGDAARAAAWVAAWDAALYAMILLVPSIDEKHRKHAEARMDVWRRGYGLLCDVDGKLYVYGIKKEV